MLAKKPFEIRVALIGTASAGKSTIVNALFGDKYADTTSTTSSSNSSSNNKAVHFFRLVSSGSSTSAASILEEITKGNNNNNNNDDQIEEQWFDVELEEELCVMRKDTRLVFMDIPGIPYETDNNTFSGSTTTTNNDNKYQQYIHDNWSSFDCVVLVLDGKQGLSSATATSTEDHQTFLLKLARQNLKEQKDVPIVVLFNKVDDPDNEQQAELVEEARATVEDIFQVDDASNWSSAPLFIPISALYAFIHKSASRMSLEAFQCFLERDWIEKLGRDQLGKHKWNRLSSDEKKVQEVYDIVSSKQEVLRESNFEAFLSALIRFVGGEDVQRTLIEKQFQVSLWALQDLDFNWNATTTNNNYGTSSISDQFYNVIKEAKVLYGAEAPKNLPLGLTSEFWKIYQRYEKACLEQFTKLGPLHVHILAGPIAELLSFHKLCEQIIPDQIGVTDCLESANILIRMKLLVRQMISILLDQHNNCDGKAWMSTRKEQDGSSPSPWKKLSPLDWSRIWNSLLLLSYNRFFCEIFGNEKVTMEENLFAAQELWRQFKSPPDSNSKYCPYCGKFVTFAPVGGDEHCASCKTLFLAPVSPTCFFCRASDIDEDGLCKSTISENCKLWHQVPKIDFKNATKLSYDGKTGRLQPLFPEQYSKVVCIEIPESFSNPMHLGHVAFSVCEFIKKVELTDGVVFRHVFFTILELEPDSRILKALYHTGYTTMDQVYDMDEASIIRLEYEGFDDKAKQKLESSDKELLLLLLDWVDHLKKKAPDNTITPMDWVALTAEDFWQYRSTRGSDDGVTAATQGSSTLYLQATSSPQASAGSTKSTTYVPFGTPKASISTSNDTVHHPYPRKSPRQMLTTFYRHYNPSKISDIDNLLVKYRGNEEAMFRKLAQKYDVDESMFGLTKSEGTASSSPAGFGSQSSPSPFSAPTKPTPSPFLGASTASSVSLFGQQVTTKFQFGNPASTTPRATNVSGSSASLATTMSSGLPSQSSNGLSPLNPFGTGYTTISTGQPMSSPSTGGPTSPFSSTNDNSGSTGTNASGAAPISFANGAGSPKFSFFGTPAVSNSFGSVNPTVSNATQPPSPLGSAMMGTRTVPFNPTCIQDGPSTVDLQSISAMDAYQNKSFEELRCEDYLMRYSSLSP